MNAQLREADLTGANFADASLNGADLRQAHEFAELPTTTTRNVVFTAEDQQALFGDGTIQGLRLHSTETFLLPVSRDGFGFREVINVTDEFVVEDGATLRFMLGDTRFPTCSCTLLKVDAKPELGGTLEVRFASPGSYHRPGARQIFQWNAAIDESNRFAVLDFPAGTEWDVSDLYATGSVRLLQVTFPGDVDFDGQLTSRDIDAISGAIRAGIQYRDSLDVNDDRRLDNVDLSAWVKSLRQTWFGDANLDGEFNSSDLILALAAGTYATDADAGWSSGDFDGNGRFDSGDLVLALADGGYEQGPRAANAAVPEPHGVALLLSAVGWFGRISRRK